MATTTDRETAAARALLAEYAAVYPLADPWSVPVEDIAASFLGLLIRDEALDEGVSGELRIRQHRICVNAAEGVLWPRRRRFTIAHEIGHWVLHRDDVADCIVTRTIEHVPRDAERATTPEQVREREANRFAAELLMPEDRVHAAVAAHGRDVVGQADRFDVSALSMAWRLFNLSYLGQRPRRADFAAID